MHAGLSDTIYALASGHGRAAVAVVRVSGAHCSAVLLSLAGALPPPRRAVLRVLRDAEHLMLDRAIVLWFPGPSSYTGEDCCELHLHGGIAVIEAVLVQLGKLGARPAAPGEFTRRAVMAGRMGLLEAEAVADLIEAETTAQRDQALQQMSGALGAIYHGWAARLLRLLAQQEALIDFPDEDLPPAVTDAMVAEMAALVEEMQAHLNDDGRGERLRAGLIFAIAGAPNVGKSTLINALCQRDVAIVSPFAGTTRDVLEARLDLSGIPVTLLDMAGLRETDDAVEAEGVRRARNRLRTADLVIWLHDGESEASQGESGADARVVLVQTKADLAGKKNGLAVSAATGEGMDDLLAVLRNAARALAGPRGVPALSRARHRQAVQQSVMCLAAASEVELSELRGEELRLAVQALGRITGDVVVDDVLDSIFSQFCIGK